MTPSFVVETKKVIEYLILRNLIKQYQKAKKYILEGVGYKAVLSKREPKEDDIWYFRINKQYRAFCTYDKITGELLVFKIDDHSHS